MIAVVDASVAIKWFRHFKPDEAQDDLLDWQNIERRTLHTPGATLITADRRYFDKAGEEGGIVLPADWVAG